VIIRVKFCCLFIVLCIAANDGRGQSHFALGHAGGDHLLFKTPIQSGASACTGSGNCNWEYLGISEIWDAGLSFSPEGKLYGLTPTNPFAIARGIYEVDTLDGTFTLLHSFPGFPDYPSLEGLVCTGGGICYTTFDVDVFTPEGDSLLQINLATGVRTNLGEIPFSVNSDIALFNGQFYFIDRIMPDVGLINLDIVDPSNSFIALTAPGIEDIVTITASSTCNYLVGDRYTGSADEMEALLINLIDGDIIPICPIWDDSWVMSTMHEHIPSNCEIIIDLDCDDSSGADDFDYNSNEFTCLTDGVPVTDFDIGLVYDAVMEEMRIEITGFIPDAPFEILTLNGSVSNLDVNGDGTYMITLTNTGNATGSDFKDALRLIRYENNAPMPTGGMRNAEVQFTTSSGAESNIAAAYIDVVELPIVPVDLGPDQQICEGESVTFDAGIPGVIYEWSIGEQTQLINVDESGSYSVTVEDGVNCPGADTVDLQVLPIVNVSLSGETEICDNEVVNLVINTDSPFSLAIEISSNPGSPFSFPDVNGNYSFSDLINEETTYTITSIVPSQDACVTITDPEHIVDVYPTFNHTIETSICDGDSVWLGFYWETEAGIYANTFSSFDGCDSVVTTTIIIVPAIQLSAQGTTCDTSEIGVFINTIDNPNGCDTTITTTITLAPADTTQLAGTSCVLAQSGIYTDTLSNLAGCDSLIISTINYIPPSDTTFVNGTTCDSAQLGVSQLIIPSLDGCDSLVITTTTFATSDTSHVSGTSCDSASIGVFQTLLQNQQGCDSLIILTVSPGIPDTTYSTATSCDSSTLGTFVTHLVGVNGCDSVVFQTVTYSAVDSTFADDSTCDPGNTGVFVEMYVNQFGCDSIVTTTVSLLPSDIVSISGTTCDPDDAGVMIEELQNVNGCDSIVTTTISLLPSHATDLFETTCISSEAGVFVSTLINQYGCDSIVTLTVELVDADTTRLDFMTCFEDEVGSTETLFAGADGCDSLVISETALYPETVVTLETLYDYNGYDISCEGGEDGGIVAFVNGLSPFTYQWSTGSPDQMITGLSAGNYELTITNYVGCEVTSEITLTEPSALALAFSISEPGCFDNALGSIEAIASGGVPPYSYSLDGATYQSSSAFGNLSNGIYQITAIDDNDCETTEIVSIHVPLTIQVELGADQVIAIGDSTEIMAIVNLPFDSIASIDWHSIDSIECPNCLTQIVAPVITTAYSIAVSSVDGCADADTMTVHVSTDHNFYIPNIFSPNGDGINDVITIHASQDIQEILAFSIFDRWGNLVFGKNSTINEVIWDGTFDGKSCNPGVFSYLAKVRYKDGLVESRYGDITLLR
jgi:gliding motility-associated-like protein